MYMNLFNKEQRRVLLNKRVIIQNKFGGGFEGIVSGFRKDRICLTSMIIHHGGDLLAFTASKSDNVRWFKIENIEIQLVTN